MANTFINTQWLTRNASSATVEALIDTLLKCYKVFSCPISRWNREGCRSLFGTKIARGSGKFIWSMRFYDALQLYTPLQYERQFSRILFCYLDMPPSAFDQHVRDRKELTAIIKGTIFVLYRELDRRDKETTALPDQVTAES